MTVTAEASTRSSTLAALRHAQFRRIWAASLVSQTGSWFMITARAFLVYDLTGSTSALATIYFFSLIPMLLFSQIGGALADSRDRRRLLIECQVAMTLGSIAIGIVAQSGVANLVNLCALAFVYGVAQALSMPAQQALVPALVPRNALTSAISLQSVTNSGSRIVGPLLAGLLLPVVGASWLFYLNSISFVFVIAAWSSVRVQQVQGQGTRRARGATLEALRYARARPPIFLPLAAAGVVGGIGLSYSPQVASFATVYLANGDTNIASRYYGFLQMAIGVGSVFGVIVLPRVGYRHPGGALIVGVFGFGIALMVLGLAPTFAVSLVTCVVLGGMQFATGAHVMSLLQHNVAEDLRGRVISLYQIAFVGLFPVLGLVAGAMSSVFSIAAVFTATGGLCIVCAIPIALRRRDVKMSREG